MKYNCPTCERSVHGLDATCPGCGEDLAEMARLNELPDACFNRGLDLARKQSWLEATRQLFGCVYLRPSDASAWVLLGKIFAEQGLKEQALGCFVMAGNDSRAHAGLEACSASDASLDQLKGM